MGKGKAKGRISRVEVRKRRRSPSAELSRTGLAPRPHPKITSQTEVAGTGWTSKSFKSTVAVDSEASNSD